MLNCAHSPAHPVSRGYLSQSTWGWSGPLLCHILLTLTDREEFLFSEHLKRTEARQLLERKAYSFEWLRRRWRFISWSAIEGNSSTKEQGDREALVLFSIIHASPLSERPGSVAGRTAAVRKGPRRVSSTHEITFYGLLLLRAQARPWPYLMGEG